MKLSEVQARLRLMRAVKMAGSQKNWAAAHDVSPQYLNDVLNGHKAMGHKILRALGLKRVVMYEVSDTP